MKSKLNNLMCFVLVLCLAGVAQVSAGTFRNWTDASGDHDWFTPENWSPNGVPQANDDGDGTSIAQNSPGATIAGPGAVTWDLYVGGLDVPLTPGTLTIDGGTLFSGRSSSTGFHGNGTVNMLSGTWDVVNWMHWGRGGHATFNMSGGSVTVGNEFSVGAGHGENGQAIVNLSGGGVITAGSLFVINNPAESWIDITEGTLIISNDVVGLINDYMGNGRILTNGGAVSLDYDGTNAGMTTLNVVPEPATMVLLGLGGLALRRRKKN